MTQYKVRITFTEPLLGTVPMNQELYADYIATKLPDGNGDASDELATVEEMTEKGTTGFHRLDGAPIIYDYVIKGFFKDACGMLRRVPGTQSVKPEIKRAYKKIIDGLVFIRPRQIPITAFGAVSILERPLRAQTAQGERVALARSEMLPDGSEIEFVIDLLDAKLEPAVREWLDYGSRRGLGQWRNGGYGTFLYTMDEVLL